MTIGVRIGASAAIAAVCLTLGGCAPAADPAVSDGPAGTPTGAGGTTTASPSGKTLSGPSDYAECPDDVAAGFTSTSNVEWRLLELEEVWVPASLDVPVPSCALSNPGGDWVELVYVGAGAELVERLTPQLLENDYVLENQDGEEWSSYRAADDSLVAFEFAPTVSREHLKSEFLGAPYVLVRLMGVG